MTPDDLAAALRAAVVAAVAAGELAVEVPASTPVETSRTPEHGDYASSVAMRLAKAAGRPPREVAETIATHLRRTAGIATVEVAGPGFLNLRLAADALGAVARHVVAAGPAYGRNETLAGQHLNLEFVSANPTGPLHIGAVRWAAVGDALGRLLSASGAHVTREYYFNDAGSQIDRFALSLLAAARGEPTPEDGYGGDYVPDIAKRVLDLEPDALTLPDPAAQEAFRRVGVELMFAEIKASLAGFGVHFDTYFSEQTLHDSGRLTQAVERLRAAGHVYDADGALWLRTTDFGDDKDRVLVKSDGEPTYFTADCAYYLDKRERGADKVLIMLGADHHGYVGRMRAMVACFGDDPAATLEILIGQLVNLVRAGQPVRMSKRAGTVVSMEDLVDAVGVDAARYALARSSADSMIDLDLDLLSRQASDNPVFYVQYAATRAASVARSAADLGLPVPDPASTDVALLTSPREVDLLRALADFPRVVATAAELREPHRIARYLEESVARPAQRFWDEDRVLPMGDEEATPLTAARLLLWRATRVVLANGLALLGVAAPERM